MQGLLEAFITLFVIMDPIASIPIFLNATKGMPNRDIMRSSSKAVFTAGALLFLFLFLGLEIFDLFGINLNSFQIAGGLILLVMGILYVLGISSKMRKHAENDVSVPIGIPLLTGPGVITTTILIVKENGPMVASIAALLTLFLTWIIFANSSKLYKLLGENGTVIITRVMGILLSAIAIELIKDGILDIMRNV